jgi:3',5'-cyclic AMP phosphodiesterase CpdA
VVIAAAGDIADDDLDAERTAQLLDRLRPALVLALGDIAYERGSIEEYRSYFDPTWGRHKAKLRPVPGNHEYGTPGAAGYFEYFGSAAGVAGQGYYSFDVGRWHLVALNSNCTAVGGCGRGSAQERWLRRDLKSSRARCTLAYWHHPRFSSGNYADDPTYDAFWRALHERGADVVLNGHDHNYQRYAPQDSNGTRDPRRGLRQFVVGTGGKNTRPVDPPPVRNREAANGETLGVLKLTLRPAGYEWRFVPVDGGSFVDSGTGTCH